MAKKEFRLYGKTLEELKAMPLKELAKILRARARRTLLRGLKEEHKILLKKIRSGKEKLKTHCRDMIIIPQMVGLTIMVHNGKDFIPVKIEPEMIGHYLGEFVISRKRVQHSAPGIGATRSSAALSVR